MELSITYCNFFFYVKSNKNGKNSSRLMYGYPATADWKLDCTFLKRFCLVFAAYRHRMEYQQARRRF